MDAELSMETDRTRAVEKMTTFSVSLCNAVVDAWFNLFRYLMVTFRDGFIVTPQPLAHPADKPIAKVEEPGYSDDWYDRIIADTGNHWRWRRVIASPLRPLRTLHCHEAYNTRDAY